MAVHTLRKSPHPPVTPNVTDYGRAREEFSLFLRGTPGVRARAECWVTGMSYGVIAPLTHGVTVIV